MYTILVPENLHIAVNKKKPLEASNFFPMNRYCLIGNRKYDILLGKKVL